MFTIYQNWDRFLSKISINQCVQSHVNYTFTEAKRVSWYQRTHWLFSWFVIISDSLDTDTATLKSRHKTMQKQNQYLRFLEGRESLRTFSEETLVSPFPPWIVCMSANSLKFGNVAHSIYDQEDWITTDFRNFSLLRQILLITKNPF